jgi:hypothetical protein
MSMQDLPTPGLDKKDTGVADDDVLEEVAIAVHLSINYYQSIKL